MLGNYINDLIFKKVFKFEQDKILMMNKVPFVFFPAKAMAVFVQKISEDLGRDEVTKISYRAGEIVADDFIEAFEWSKAPLPGKMAAINRMFEVMGHGKLDIQKWDSVNNKWLLHVTNHPVIEWGKILFKEKQKICPFYMAIWSAHLHKEMGVEGCWLMETQCIARGARYCEMSYNYFDPSLALKDP